MDQVSRMAVSPFHMSLAEHLAKARQKEVSLAWLGQAGFVIDSPELRIVIDPYLSDTLAAKYAASNYPHERMHPAPIDPAHLGPVDLVLCTHHHTDHMDGETLRALAARLPALRFVVPAASKVLAAERIGVADDRLIPVDAGDRLEPVPGLVIDVLRAAHETLERDSNGRHVFLGYGLSLAGVRILHSGDTVPFDGQAAEIRRLAPDIALLPVNGRSTALAQAGFAGNLTLAEAVELCLDCIIPAMIAHHHGLFAFNTADPDDIDHAARSVPFDLQRARLQVAYVCASADT